MIQKRPQDRTQLVPFENASDLHFRIARSFDLINHWNAALSGQYHFDDVITIMTRQVQAATLSLFRYEDGRAQSISTQARALDDYQPTASTGTLLAFLLATDPHALTPGTIWRLSTIRKMPGFDQSQAATEWNAKPGLIEVSIVIIGNEDGKIDALEMCFDHKPEVNADIPPALITQAMANAWSLRAPGLITRLIKNKTRSRSRRIDSTYILGPDNPAALSRAEQRVCHLVVDGENAKTISERLGLSVSTVRTHLRSIYAKTETTGQVNLISLIQQQREDAGL